MTWDGLTPPVVGDPNWCPEPMADGVEMPHDWVRAGQGNPVAVKRQGLDYEVCRYCGRRKPPVGDAATAAAVDEITDRGWHGRP